MILDLMGAVEECRRFTINLTHAAPTLAWWVDPATDNVAVDRPNGLLRFTQSGRRYTIPVRSLRYVAVEQK